MVASESQSEEENKTFRSLTNIDGLSCQITKTLYKEYKNIQVATKTNKTVGAILPKVKDQTPKDEQNNVVYKIQCADCDACYIGMTKTKLKTRISGHRSLTRRLQTLREAGYTNTDAAVIEVRSKSALMDHATATNHQFKLEEAEIIDKTTKASSLPILESCHIKNTDKTVNKRTDTDNLNTNYASLLHLIKTTRENEKRDQNRNNRNTHDAHDTNTTVTIHTTQSID